MAGRSGQRLKTKVVEGVEVIGCSKCDGRIVDFTYGASFHDDMLKCENKHTSWHNFKKGDKVILNNGIIMEYDGNDFAESKTRANYKRWAELILSEAESFKE